MITNKVLNEQLLQLAEKVNILVDSSCSAAENLTQLKDSVSRTNNELNSLEKRSEENGSKISDTDLKVRKLEDNQKKLVDNQKKLNDDQKKIEKQLDKLSEELSQLKDNLNTLNNTQIPAILKEIQRSKKVSEEAVWAEVFNNAISDSKWLKNRSFCPGRWAMAYPALYTLFRILDDMHPKNILELGLGQSTRMICQYVSANEDTKHYIVENDESWIGFFCENFETSSRSEFCVLPLEMRDYGDVQGVRAFEGFADRFSGQKYDFICVDAPQGVDMKILSRIDVLSIIPQCLADTFAILVDDSNRSGEKGTLREIERTLSEAGIEYERGSYVGQKNTTVICSKNIKFLCTL